MKLLKAIKSLICGIILPPFAYWGFSKDSMCVCVYTHLCTYMYIHIYMYVYVYIIQLGILSFKCDALS